MTRARYDVYLDTPLTGRIHAADCVVEEDGGMPIKMGFRYRGGYLGLRSAFSLDPVQLPLAGGETTLVCRGGVPAIIDDYLPELQFDQPR